MHQHVQVAGLSRGWVIALAAALALGLLPMATATAQTPPPDRTDLENACPAGRVPASGFTDTAGNTHEHAIECAAWWDITRGGPGGRPANQYGPRLDVYRDQMASFIARLIDESEGTELPAWDGENRFADVPANNVHLANINRLAEAGVVLGRTQREYAPRMVVRRDQMASFIARAIEFVTGEARTSNVSYFADVTPTNPHRQSINGLYEEGVVQGRSPGVYAPAASVRRDAMAAFVMRAMDVHVEEGFATLPDGEPPGPTQEPTPSPTPGPTGDPEPSTTTQSVVDAPELLAVETLTLTGAAATVRFTFDEDVRSTDVVPARFRLYGIDSQFEASTAVRQAVQRQVVATFTRAQYDDATTAAVAYNAVQNLPGRGNPERALGLKSANFPAGRTSAPDLVSVSNFRAAADSAVDVDFLFDAPVAVASTTGTPSFGVVLADGTQHTGHATNPAPNSATVTVRLPNPGMTAAAVSSATRRAFTQDGAATAADDGPSSPRRAIGVSGGQTATPNLVGVTLNRAQHEVVYTFDRSVVLEPGTAAERAARFAVYYVDGTQRAGSGGTTTSTPPTVNPQNPTQVTVRFPTDSVNAFVVGASLTNGAVRGLEGVNGVDSAGIAAEFLPGHVLGPRLVSAKIAAQPIPMRFTVTWVFDKSTNLVTNPEERGEFAVYRADGRRVTIQPSEFGVLQNCSAPTAVERTCDVQLSASEPKLAAVEYATVENAGNQTGGSGTIFRNYEQARSF